MLHIFMLCALRDEKCRLL